MLILAMVGGSSTAFGWSFPTVGCDAQGRVTGLIEVPQTQGFDIYVTDHRPGESVWLEIPGSRQSMPATSGGLILFGPLDISNVRPGAYSIRVEQTATPEKSESFPPCPKPTKTP